MGLMIIFLLEF